MEKLKTAQFVIKTNNSSVSSGFNQFVCSCGGYPFLYGGF
jgi:hypothetical protein